MSEHRANILHELVSHPKRFIVGPEGFHLPYLLKGERAGITQEQSCGLASRKRNDW